METRESVRRRIAIDGILMKVTNDDIRVDTRLE